MYYTTVITIFQLSHPISLLTLQTFSSLKFFILPHSYNILNILLSRSHNKFTLFCIPHLFQLFLNLYLNHVFSFYTVPSHTYRQKPNYRTFTVFMLYALPVKFFKSLYVLTLMFVPHLSPTLALIISRVTTLVTISTQIFKHTFISQNRKSYLFYAPRSTYILWIARPQLRLMLTHVKTNITL